jgi:NADPH2 dehydrogenase
MNFPKISALKTAELFSAHLARAGIRLPFRPNLCLPAVSPFRTPIERSWLPHGIGNRFAILPMEGWDGETDGRPTELTRRRWRNFGLSGAKLIWGGEAVAVRHDGRANPNQLLLNDVTAASIEGLRRELVISHRDRFGTDHDLFIGLQLTHSGRFARPHLKSRPEPKIVYRHPYLDAKVGVDDNRYLLTDDEIAGLVNDFVRAAKLAYQLGFAFVDIKHCHSYLGHEFLSAVDRPGRYGGSLENRLRFLREIVEGIRAEAPRLLIGVRLSIFDCAPFVRGENQIGIPVVGEKFPFACGLTPSGQDLDMSGSLAVTAHLDQWGVKLLCTTGGSPYFTPHLTRPAMFPPSDGYHPPEDPLVGVARHVRAGELIKQHHPDFVVVGSGYSYLQEWLPNVGEEVLAKGKADSVGLGRMVLSYPDLPADVLAGKTLERKKICRTFSECTTAPRNEMVSGCYPLDLFYKARPEHERLREISQASKIR